jgi:nitrate reductase alpha subunit
VVPDYAEVYYYARHADRNVLRDIFTRIVSAAEGAAQGTGTKVEYEIIGGVYDLLPVEYMARIMHSNLNLVGGVKYSQWKYEKLTLSEILSPLADRGHWSGSLIDCNVRAERMGWLPTSPQLETNPLEVCRAAEQAGKEPAAYATEGLKSGQLRMSCADPDNPKNFPRNLFVWRSNLLGASGKGHEYFLKHLLGAKNGVLGKDLGAMDQAKPEEVTWREGTPDGKQPSRRSDEVAKQGDQMRRQKEDQRNGAPG